MSREVQIGQETGLWICGACPQRLGERSVLLHFHFPLSLPFFLENLKQLRSGFDMGRTLLSYRQMLEKEQFRWRAFRDALREEKNRQAFDSLWKSAHTYADAGSITLRPVLFDSVVFSMLLSLSGEIRCLKDQVEGLREQLEASGSPRGQSANSASTSNEKSSHSS